MTNNVDLVVEGAAAAVEGVSTIVVEKTGSKLIRTFAGLPVLGKVATITGGVALGAVAGYGLYKCGKYLFNRFFKKPAPVAEQPAENKDVDLEKETTEENK